MVHCHHISFRYSSKSERVLDDFSHDFGSGIHLIKGYSGCGKSTLLRIIGGYLKPETGSVEIDGFKDNSLQFQKVGLGFVFQQLNLLPLASVGRNLQLAASLAGISTEKRDANAARFLKLLGLENFTQRLPKTMSGGQQQRATIARALIKEPRVLLLDEPTSGLDDLNTAIIIKVLRDFIAEDERVAIICTHDSRLDTLANDILDFNRFLPLEGHLETLV